MEKNLVKSIEEKKQELDEYRPLDTSIAKKLSEQFILEWTYNSNAIEGNTLTDDEVEKISKDIKLPPSKKYQETEVKNILNTLNSLLEEAL